MSKNILVVSTSFRKDSNSEILADEFIKGAQEAGHSVEKVSLNDKRIEFCRGCLACQKTMTCVIKDDASTLTQKMLNAEVVVFATPIYFYEMSGQMKTLLDRTNPLFPADYKFRDIYLLATAADKEQSAMDGALKGLQGWLDCFEKTQLKGVIRAVGAEGAGDIRNMSNLLSEAYNMGKKI